MSSALQDREGFSRSFRKFKCLASSRRRKGAAKSSQLDVQRVTCRVRQETEGSGEESLNTIVLPLHSMSRSGLVATQQQEISQVL